MQLSLRLSAVAGLVTRGNRLVDVGCDHGYLPVYLYQNQIIPKAIAMDVRKGPLSRAQEHIAQYGLGEYIETRLSDGLAAAERRRGRYPCDRGNGRPSYGEDTDRRRKSPGEFFRDDFAAAVRYSAFSQISFADWLEGRGRGADPGGR